MASLASIEKILADASSLLDQAAIEIRDAPLDPAHANILHVSNALSEIFEIRQLIYALAPQLMPDNLKGPHADADKALERAVRRARALEGANAIPAATGVLELFLANEPSSQHQHIARSEIARLQASARPT